MAINSMAIPIPSEIILPFTGYLVFIGRFSMFWAVLASTIGAVLGSWLIYWLALFGGRPLIKRLRFIFHDLEMETADRFFKKLGPIAVFICRVLPIIHTYISLPAGLFKMRFWPFTFYTAIGALIWNWLLIFVGFKAGENWQAIKETLKPFDGLILVIIILGIIWWVWWHAKRAKNPA